MTNEQKTLCQRCCIELEPWEQSLCFACASRECELTYVVRVSGGAGSTVAAHRCVEKHGAKNTVLLFADTNSEDESLSQREAAFFARTGYSILRDRRGGTSKPMTLLDLEQRILSDDLKGLSEFRSTCGCMTPAVVTDSEGGLS